MYVLIMVNLNVRRLQMTGLANEYREGYYAYLAFFYDVIPFLLKDHKEWLEENYPELIEDYYENKRQEETNEL